MSFPDNVQVYSQNAGTSSLPGTVIQTRVPASTDSNYKIGQIWVDKTNDGAYALTSLSSSSGIVSATWTSLGSATGDLDTLTTDDATVVSATSGTIIVAGASGELTTTGANSPGTVTVGLDANVVTPGTLTVTGLLTCDASAVIDTAGTALNLATDVDTAAVNIGTAAAARVITVGNVTGATDVSIDTGTAGFTVTTTGSGDINLTSTDVLQVKGVAGSGISNQVTNSDNTNVASDASYQVATGGTSSGDPYINFLVSGAGVFSMGIDNSDSDNFVLSANAALGTSNVVTITSAGALQTAAAITADTAITATLGDITATDGNLVLVAAGNKINRTSVATTTAAGANSVGTVTLVGGTAIIATTSVTTNSLIRLSRQSVGATGAAALGEISAGTIVNGTSFVINAWQQSDATALQTTDVSSIYWELTN